MDLSLPPAPDNAGMQFLKALSPKTVGILAAIITVFIWTAFIVIGRASVRGVLTPFDIGLLRIVGASTVLLPLGAWLVRNDRRQSGAEGAKASSFFGLSPLGLRVTAVCGLFGGLGYAALVYSGFSYAPAAHASVLIPGTLPLWTALFAVILLREKLSWSRLLGLACIVGGGLLVGGDSLLGALEGDERWKGDLLFVLAAMSWAAYSVLARHHALNAVRVTTAVTVFAFFSYLPAYALLLWLGLAQSHLAQAPWGELLFQLTFQGLASVVISGITFTRMIQQFGPVHSTMLTSLVPGLSALGAVLFLDEPMFWNLLIGLVLVTLGILFGVRKPISRPT